MLVDLQTPLTTTFYLLFHPLLKVFYPLILFLNTVYSLFFMTQKLLDSPLKTDEIFSIYFAFS